ncbi:hypothetical protein PPTG_09076 [Phytophthora nicotianae INRA-310]|uniref:FAR1 domain-containing protein n=1 Tax=Phytophthora nicotianae (strain INRA-310) TaxID=761204 RepID=W2QHZ9_PHYN3|nr:hypothetical protein PPTG_09076 [Phytophthora nicotianae INRA-310]ETN12179.1 hypothetical protein PPTG_09076 [Phytophthora nicotianae INRA-310]
MERRPRSAQKRRQHAAPSDDDSASDNGDSDVEWTLDSGHSSVRSSESSSQFETQSAQGEEGSATEASCALAPPLGQTQFDSWESFHAYLNAYMAQTYQSFRIRTNNKVQERNRKIKKQNDTAPLIPQEWIWYNKTLVCTHAGRYKTRGKGKRPRQEVRSTECCAQINACVRVVNGSTHDPVFALCVTTAKLQHNYPLTLSNYEQYSSVRTALAPSMVETVDVLRKAGSMSSKLKELHLQSNEVRSSCREYVFSGL